MVSEGNWKVIKDSEDTNVLQWADMCFWLWKTLQTDSATHQKHSGLGEDKEEKNPGKMEWTAEETDALDILYCYVMCLQHNLALNLILLVTLCSK